MSSNEPGGNAPPAFPFSPQDALAFMQKMWNPLGVPDSGLRIAGRDAVAAEAAAVRSRIRR